MINERVTGVASSSPNVELVRKLYESSARGYKETVSKIIDTEIKLEVMESFPHGGIYHGYKAMDDFFACFLQDFEEWHAEPHEILDAGENIATLGQYQGRVKGTSFKVTAPFVHILSLNNGKVVRMRQYTDTVKIVRALAGERDLNLD